MRAARPVILGLLLAAVAGCALVAPHATEAIRPQTWDGFLVALGADIEAAIAGVLKFAGWFF